MSGKRYLLLCGFSPAAQHGGNVILQDLFRELPEGSLYWYNLRENTRLYVNRQRAFAGSKVFRWTFPIRALQYRRLAWIRIRLIRWFIWLERSFLARRIRRIINDISPDRLILYVHPRYLHVYKAVVETTNVPFHLTVHDDP